MLNVDGVVTVNGVSRYRACADQRFNLGLIPAGVFANPGQSSGL
jgi:hypothetical protein